MAQQHPTGELKLRSLVVCTRVHLGKSSVPPTDEFLTNAISSFVSLVLSSRALKGAIAVDSEPKIDGYDLPLRIKTLLANIVHEKSVTDMSAMPEIDILPISPWGEFVPALNALVAWASKSLASYVLFASAEIATWNEDGITRLVEQMDENTLVVGAVLPGHEYNPQLVPQRLPLTGVTTPWNTLALWNVPKLALTGFPLVAEGIHTDENGSAIAAGVEEVSTIYILQKLLPPGTAEAKLIQIPGIMWDTKQWDDDARQKWHESKMQSKVQRAAKQLNLLLVNSSIDMASTVLHL